MVTIFLVDVLMARMNLLKRCYLAITIEILLFLHRFNGFLHLQLRIFLAIVLRKARII